jgi:hypothetical protein
MSNTTLCIRQAYGLLLDARSLLQPEEEYLREALEEQLSNFRILWDKICMEEVLIRDRNVLLSDPSIGLGEHLDGS